jgi:undecaprenyl-diphosphatase
MNILQAFIIGIIEGITEFLPISSTAHITLTGELLNIAPDDFFKSFMVIIQLGALLPVLFYYLYKYRLNFAVHSRIFTAFIPTAIIGFLLYKIIKNILLGNIAITYGHY